MSFLNPIFLFALIAVGLPLLIHLLNLKRPRKVAFSTLAFFRELKNTTIRRIRIKKYLLLLLRVAAIGCLALVLARPFLPPGLSGGGTAQAPALNAVLLDNSISMFRIGKQGPLFDYAREIVGKIEESAKDDDRFMLQLTNGEGEYSNILSRANLQKTLEGAEIMPAGNFIKNRLTGLIESVREAPYQNKNIFIITDGQLSQLNDLQEMDLNDITLTFIDVGDVDVQNTIVSDISTSTNMIGANIPFILNVELANRSSVNAVNQFVTLDFEGQNAGQYSIALEPNERKTFTFEITPSQTGSAKGKLEIEGDEFQPDNEYYFTVQVPETRNILWVHEQSRLSDYVSYTGAMLRVAGENDAQLAYQEVSPNAFETTDLSKFDAIILDALKTVPEYSFQLLQDYVQNGGGLMFFPSENGTLSNYNSFFSKFNAGRFEGLQGEYASFNSVAKADELLEDHPAFNGLFEREQNEQLRFTNPDIYYYLKLSKSPSGTGFDLMTMNNGDVLMYEKRFGEGSLMIASIGNDPGWSNFPVKPLFAPFYYRLLLYSASSDQGGFANYRLGDPFSWQGNIDGEKAVINVGEDEIKPTVDVVPSGIRLRYPAEEWTPGWVTVTDETKEYVLSANLNSTESDFREITEEQLQDLMGNTDFTWLEAGEMEEEELQDEIMSSGFGKEIWNWFMLAGLLFLIAETFVSMWYKAETVS
ncbi:MAG: BatA domain-containing protein [Gracilimonas sp.]|uniref:BatA domain-containing protein n=1 Tax=Gracilimonas sp. TaxID=1974203 RepID=UPI0019A3EA5E|nr:BatA domain-containing protein [Gracilimonas sp.]MBD3617839.1 BatA domain-containing protein [Gracilimonas sp.]